MATLAQGQLFAHYRVLRYLGRGISGESYEAEDRRVQRKVTLKLLHPRSTLPDTTQRHFFREMQVISTFSHPYLATVFDYGEFGRQIYVARRYLSMGSLLGEEGRRWYRPPLAPANAIQITSLLAQALDLLHQHGYVHGSLTFGNILLLSSFKQNEIDQDHPPFLIADVGLAHFVHRFASVETLLPVTAAPEQLGQRVETASDQYALAIILYFWLTGQLPFRGSLEEVEHLKLSGTMPPPTRLNPQVTPLQEAILKRALSVYPEERYPTVLAFAAALQESLRAASRSFPQQRTTPFTGIPHTPIEHSPGFEQHIPSTPRPAFLPTVPATPPINQPEMITPPATEEIESPLMEEAAPLEKLLIAFSHPSQELFEQSPTEPQTVLPPELTRLPKTRSVYFIITSPYDEQAHHVTIEQSETTIGRAGASDILLEHDPQTSRHQALLKQEGDLYLLYDLHSAFGTFLNEQKITSGSGYPLHHGDQIRMGVYQLVFHLDT
jgi:serine/threonine protein kinase